MSSSTFTQRWTSANDLTTTTNSNNNKQSTPFFLRPQFAPPPPPSSSSSSSILRPSQSLISLVEPSSIPLKSRCPSSKNRLLPSRVANIIHQFESQTTLTMNNSTKVSSPIRSVFVKQWENTRINGNSPRTTPVLVVETSSPIPFTSKITSFNHKPQPVIICETVTNHNRPTPPPVSPKSPLTKTWSQVKLMYQKQTQHIESDTDSAIHTMVTETNNDSTTLSRSSTSATTDSTCSSSCSSSSNPSSPPRFARPTIASTQKQRQFISNSISFKRTNSPPSPSVTTFTRAVPLTPSSVIPLCSINEDLEQQQTLTTCFCSSEINLIDQYHRLSTPELILSNTTLSQTSITDRITINTNLPLKYKRDSLIRLYG
jgi:hypothetical protein